MAFRIVHRRFFDQVDIFADDLREMWATKQYMDAELLCADGDRVRVHKLMLAAISPVFRNILAERFLADEETVVFHLPETSADDIAAFFENLYYGSDDIALIPIGLEYLQFGGFCFGSLKTETPETPETAENVEPPKEPTTVIEEKRELPVEEKPPATIYPNPKKPEKTALPKKGSRSKVWRCFEELSKTKAKCIICAKIIVRNHGTTSNLLRHLKKSHPEDLWQKEAYKIRVKGERPADRRMACKAEDPPGLDECVKNVGSRKVAMIIWNYFKVNEESMNAQCLQCQFETDRSAAEDPHLKMVNHLRHSHPDLFEAYRLELENKDLKKSAIWNHFISTTDTSKKECLSCGALVYSQKKSTSNLIRHLQRHHKELYEGYLIESYGLTNMDHITALMKKKQQVRAKNCDPASRTCQECKQEFLSRKKMLSHYKAEHSSAGPPKETTFLCSQCGKTFKRRHARDRHEMAHMGDRRFPCSFCGKRFLTNQQRKLHERVHTGEKPHQCPDCGRQFSRRHQLTSHARTHTGDMPYMCEMCELRFKHLSTLKNHRCKVKVASTPPPETDSEFTDTEEQISCINTYT